MILNLIDLIAVVAAFTAILMAGSTHLRMNLGLYSTQTILLAAVTALLANSRGEPSLYWVAILIALLKGCGVPSFLRWIMKKIAVGDDPGTYIAAPLAMHLSVVLLGPSYFLISGLSPFGGESWASATASVSLLFTGLVLMMTRRIALSQIIGFLVIENGIYLFAQTQTSGMPLIVEMGVLLDVLVGVMIAGLIVFRIQKSFEHVDVTQLSDLRD